jgi:hypothetical protein
VPPLGEGAVIEELGWALPGDVHEALHDPLGRLQGEDLLTLIDVDEEHGSKLIVGGKGEGNGLHTPHLSLVVRGHKLQHLLPSLPLHFKPVAFADMRLKAVLHMRAKCSLVSNALTCMHTLLQHIQMQLVQVMQHKHTSLVYHAAQS